MTYNDVLVRACAESGIAAFTGDGTNPTVMEMATRAIGAAGGCGAVSYTHLKHLFHFSYQRYLINQIRENFGLEHTPIRLVVRERGSGEVGAKDV